MPAAPNSSNEPPTPAQTPIKRISRLENLERALARPRSNPPTRFDLLKQAGDELAAEEKAAREK